MSASKISHLQIFIWLTIIEVAATLFYLMSIPADPKNAWLFGFSRSRLILISGIALLEAILIWLGVAFWQETYLSKRVQFKVAKLLSKRGILWGILILLVLLTVNGFLFLFQWKLAATDQQLTAYLQRLTPVVLLGTIVCIQGIVIAKLRFFKNLQDSWLYIFIVLGGYILFLWLLVAEFFVADRLFPDYFVAARFGEVLHDWIPYIIFQTALYLQLPYLLQRPLNRNFNYGWLGILISILLAYFYYNAALIHAQEVNIDLRRSDQDVYVEFTRRVSESDFTYSGVRNQTPGYPYIQALFCKAGLTTQELFMCGKQVNIILSLILLPLLYLVFRRFLPPYPALTLLLIITISFFIFKAGYMTVELSFYFVSFLGFLLMCIMLIKPSIISGIATGIILGVTHLLKASVLPGIVIFIFMYLGKEAWIWFKHKTAKTDLKICLLSLFLVVACFLAVVFPYIRQSKLKYGQYFYNVNSTFYIWYDSWVDAKQAEQTHSFTSGWPDLPPELLPSPSKYIQDHSISQISTRLFLGLKQQFSHIWNQYNAFNYISLYLILVALFLLINRDRSTKLVKEYSFLIIFVTFYTLGYIFLFAWYYPIAGGPRFISSLYIPILFSLFFTLNTVQNGGEIRLKGYRIQLTTLLSTINIVVVAMLMADAFIVITEKLPTGYFGS